MLRAGNEMIRGLMTSGSSTGRPCVPGSTASLPSPRATATAAPWVRARAWPHPSPLAAPGPSGADGSLARSISGSESIIAFIDDVLRPVR